MLEETDIVFGLTVEYAQKNNFDGIIYGHDFGHNGGTFISPSLFKDTIARVMARRSDILHEAGFKHILHACGNNRAVMDMLIDAGVDVYQSIQPEMPIAELKKSFGDRLTLWGGVTAELLLAGASETELRQCCRKALVDCAEDNGGFIYGTSHSVMPGAIPVKYQIMIEELKEWNDNKQRGDNEHLVMGSPIECGRTTLETC
jgi:uroporphyrinogen decarboxylase